MRHWIRHDTDTIYGTERGDRLHGGRGDDVIYGRGGNDWIFGWSGDDKLYGGSGNDWLFGGRGNDVLHGGSGNDMMNGEGGTDVVQASGSLNYTATDSQISDGTDTDSYFEFELLSIIGDSAANTIDATLTQLHDLCTVFEGSETVGYDQ